MGLHSSIYRRFTFGLSLWVTPDAECEGISGRKDFDELFTIIDTGFNARAVAAYVQEQIALALVHERAATERLALRSAQSAREGAEIAESLRSSAARMAASPVRALSSLQVLYRSAVLPTKCLAVSAEM